MGRDFAAKSAWLRCVEVLIDEPVDIVTVDVPIEERQLFGGGYVDSRIVGEVVEQRRGAALECTDHEEVESVRPAHIEIVPRRRSMDRRSTGSVPGRRPGR